MIKSFCRQCHAAVSSNAANCPMCGLSRPNHASLNHLEKEYLENAPLVPAKYHEMLDTVNPKESLGKNIALEMRNYLGNPAMAMVFYVCFLSAILGGGMLLMNTLFPLSFMMLWAGLVYLGYDSVQFSRAVVTSFLVKRLQLAPGVSPYSVHFRIEAQLIQMLQSLQMVISSFAERQNDPHASQASLDSFITATKALTERISKYAQLSLETDSIIWRNNVYAIVAMNMTSQEKVIAIGNKIKEAEAIIFRFRWLLKLSEINEHIKACSEGVVTDELPDSRAYGQMIIKRYFLSQHGPMAEPYAGNFEHVPYEIPFKMRFFWHQQLPPFPLSEDDMAIEVPQAKDLLESIKQVRSLKAKLEEQMVLDYATNAISEVSALSNNSSATTEAEELKRFQLYSKFLDIPKFQPDSQELQKETDRLKAEVRVAMGFDNTNF